MISMLITCFPGYDRPHLCLPSPPLLVQVQTQTPAVSTDLVFRLTLTRFPGKHSAIAKLSLVQSQE